jgi:hypothetical protein
MDDCSAFGIVAKALEPGERGDNTGVGPFRCSSCRQSVANQVNLRIAHGLRNRLLKNEMHNKWRIPAVISAGVRQYSHASVRSRKYDRNGKLFSGIVLNAPLSCAI